MFFSRSLVSQEWIDRKNKEEMEKRARLRAEEEKASTKRHKEAVRLVIEKACLLKSTKVVTTIELTCLFSHTGRARQETQGSVPEMAEGEGIAKQMAEIVTGTRNRGTTKKSGIP